MAEKDRQGQDWIEAGSEMAQVPVPERALLAQLFEAAPDGNLLSDEEGRIVLASARAAAMFGYQPGELTGMTVDSLVPRAQRGNHSRLRQGYRKHPSLRPMAERKAAMLELAGQRKDGSVFPVEITLSPIHAGGHLYVLSVVRDISARVAQESEARRQAALVRLLQEVAVASNESDSIETAFQFALDRLCEFLGWPLGHAFLLDEDEGLSPLQMWCASPRERFSAFIAASEAIRFSAGVGLPGMVLSMEKPVWFNHLTEQEMFLRREPARECGLRTGLAMPVKAGREVIGVLEFYHDEDIQPDEELLLLLPNIGMQIGRVVERKRAEQALHRQAAQLRTVMTNLPVMLFVLDRNGRVLMLEGRGVADSTLDPARLLGNSVFDQLITRPDITNLLRRALAGETFTAEIVSGTGSVFETYFTPYYDINWAVDGAIGLSFNISERKRMQSELDEMRARLMDSADAERARLAQELHDGPLQDLYGAFYQIQDVAAFLTGPEEETAGRALDTIQKVNATLRIICGELHPDTLVHLGLQRAIRGNVERLQERLENISILLDLDDDSLPEKTLSHSLRLNLYRIFQQLITNAIRHAGARHVWVRLKVEPEEVILEVQDNGTGFAIPEQWIALLRAGKYGLATAMERVRGMGGKLELSSRPGEGTLAQVSVPRRAEPPRSRPEPAAK